MEVTLNLGVLASRLLQEANPHASPCPAPSPFPAPSAAQGTPSSRGSHAARLLRSPFRDPCACLAHTPLLSSHRGLPPPCFRVRRDTVTGALAVRGPGAQGNGKAGTELGESDGRAESSGVTSSRTPRQGG